MFSNNLYQLEAVIRQMTLHITTIAKPAHSLKLNKYNISIGWIYSFVLWPSFFQFKRISDVIVRYNIANYPKQI